jgi:dienelactone hydrolase
MSCPDCFRGSVHTHGEPQGKIDTVHGIRTYIAGGSDSSSTSKSAILYMPDAFSLKLVNNLLLADQYASRTGCRVLIPDLVYGGGMSPHLLPMMEVLMEPAPSFSITGMFWKTVTLLRALPYAVPFLVFGHPKNAYPQVLAYARAMRADLPDGGKLGVAGFCWGGWCSTKLCAEPAVEGGSGGEKLIDAQFNAHPSYIVDTPELVVDAITKLKVPYASAVAEVDFQFNAAVAEKTEAKVREATAGSTGDGDGYIYEFKIYKGCKHGFAVRAQENTVNMEGYQGALEQASAWFNKYLN